MLEYPTWKELKCDLFSKPEFIELGLTEKSLRLHFRNFAVLKTVYDVKRMIDPMSIMTFIVRINSFNKHNISEKEIFQSLKNHVKLGANHQFTNVLNSKTGEFLYVDPQLEKVLGISKDRFTLAALCTRDKSTRLYHPLDVKHVIRFGTLAFLVGSTLGLKYDRYNDYYNVIFRIGVEDSTDPKISSLKYVIADRKDYIGELSENRSVSKFLDQWNINYRTERFKHIEVDFVNKDPHLSAFLNSLHYICNAQILGFSIKEVIALHYLNLSDKSEDAVQLLNKDFEDKVGSLGYRTNRSFSDQIYKVKKKLNKEFLKYCVKPFEQCKPMTSLQKAKHMRLIPIPEKVMLMTLKRVTLKEDETLV